MADKKTQETTKDAHQVSTWIVTELAGPKVNGKRVKAGDAIELTEDEARSEEIIGAIKKKKPQKKTAPKANLKTEDE